MWANSIESFAGKSEKGLEGAASTVEKQSNKQSAA
jgi:hypothetical protein